MGNDVPVKGPEIPGVEIREATLADVNIIGSNLRQADQAEVEAASGQDPTLVMLMGLQGRCYVAVEDEDPFLIFGVIPDDRDSRVGIIWLLGTEKTTKFPLTFLRQSRQWVDELGEGYEVLMNVIDERNSMHLDWLKWLGFEIVHRFEEYGVARLPFLMFERRFPCVTR